jgi:AraC-like DNA-binding protein
VNAGEDARFWRHRGLPEVDLLKARYVTHRFARHAHDGYAIGVILSGIEEFECRGDLFRAGAGSVVVVNPEHDHTGHAGLPEGWSYRMLYPSIGTLGDIAAELSPGRGTPYFPERVLADPRAAALLVSAHRAAESADALAASALAHTAFGHLLTRHAAQPPRAAARSDPRAGRLAREILHERLLDPPVLGDLARAVDSRPFALLRAFKAATGLPPHAYLNALRVRRARELLDAGMPPAGVAAEVGFTDQAHLNRHFKRVVGVTPGAYRHAEAGGHRAKTYKTGGGGPF